MDLVGIAPPHLDHCLLTAQGVPVAARWDEVLGFRLTGNSASPTRRLPVARVLRRQSSPSYDISRITAARRRGLPRFAYWLDSCGARSAEACWRIFADERQHQASAHRTHASRHHAATRSTSRSGESRILQRGVHRWLQDRHRLGNHHVDGGSTGRGTVLLRESFVESFVSIYHMKVSRDGAPLYLAKLETPFSTCQGRWKDERRAGVRVASLRALDVACAPRNSIG